jgi:dienelactone hydrolase
MNHAFVGQIPVSWVEPANSPSNRRLVIWLTGFSGSKESVQPQLEALAGRGFVALSFDPFQHGERTKESRADLATRVRGNIRRFFWPILAQTAEETPMVIDWAIQQLRVNPQVGMGGVSMGGDISVAAAGVDWRIRAVAAVVATPDWMRPGSFEYPGTPDSVAQDAYERRNPLTHLDAYRSCPAITFESGAVDRQVPPDGGERFARELAKTYAGCPERLRVFLHPNTAHAFVPAMLENSIQWFERFLP